MKALKKISLLFVLIFIYTLVLSINYMPKTIAVKGEEIKISDIEVIPIGEIVGIKLYTSGILVVGTATIHDENGNRHKPYENTEIKEGDSIISVNETIVNNTSELLRVINNSNGKALKIKYLRQNKEQQCEITPVKDEYGQYKIGLWVRDSAAGVGTLTFYYEKTHSFAGLGHGITDIDTGDIIQTASGEIDNVNIVTIVKGASEEPGKIQGAIKNNSLIGSIYKNTEYGIYGIIKNESNLKIDYSNSFRRSKCFVKY